MQNTILANKVRFKFCDFLSDLFDPILDGKGKSHFYLEICGLSKAEGIADRRMSFRPFEIEKSKLKAAATFAKSLNEISCVFFSVCPRDNVYKDEDTGRYLRSTRSDISVGTVCWMDIDYKLLSDDVAKADEMARNKINLLSPAPNVIVKTPGGYHLYWFLDQAYPVEDVCYANKRMAVWTGADKCYDPVRIMRVPKGIHYKDPQNPQEVYIVHYDNTVRHSLSNFDHYCPDVDRLTEFQSAPVVIPQSIEKLDLNELKDCFEDNRLYYKILATDLRSYQKLMKNQSKAKSRSERDFHILCQLFKADVTIDQMFAIFAQYPCGDKYLEKGQNGDAYLRHQIEAAIYRVEEDRRLNEKVRNGLKQSEMNVVSL